MKYRCRASEAGSVEAGRTAAHRFFFANRVDGAFVGQPDRARAHRESRSSQPRRARAHKAARSNQPGRARAHRAARSSQPGRARAHRAARSSQPRRARAHRAARSSQPGQARAHRAAKSSQSGRPGVAVSGAKSSHTIPKSSQPGAACRSAGRRLTAHLQARQASSSNFDIDNLLAEYLRNKVLKELT